MLTMFGGLAWDVGLPVAVYYLLHALGVSDLLALLGAAVAAVARIAVVAVRRCTLNQFALIMLLVYGLGFAMALITGDPRTLLLRNSLITASIGTVFLVTAIRGRRPLTLTALQSAQPARAAETTRRYAVDPHVRHAFRLSSTVWGVGLLAEAVARIPLVYALPVEVAVAATEVLLIATLVALAGWNAWYVRRHREHFAL